MRGARPRGSFIEDRGLARSPDGTVGGRYGFRHALYRDVLSRRLGPGRRARLHLVIGARKAAGYGEHTDDIAAELAAHFEQGQDPARAAHYHREAAEKALRRRAYAEALAHADRG